MTVGTARVVVSIVPAEYILAVIAALSITGLSTTSGWSGAVFGRVTISNFSVVLSVLNGGSKYAITLTNLSLA